MNKEWSDKANTDEWLKNLQYEDVKKKFGDEDISGLIKMPLSRHWIMHIEAANRIKEKILQS